MIVNFHILEEASGMQSLLYTCRFLEQAHQEKRRVYVNANSREEAERLDALLWTFRDDSFIPHNLYQADDDCPPAIQIGHGIAPADHQGLLVNLSREFPTFYTQFSEVIEIVFADPHVQQLARERFKQYREQGHQLNTHKIKVNPS